MIKDNTISAAYLCWNQADYAMSKVTSSGNTVNVMNAGKCVTKTAEEPSSFTLNEAVVFPKDKEPPGGPAAGGSFFNITAASFAAGTAG